MGTSTRELDGTKQEVNKCQLGHLRRQNPPQGFLGEGQEGHKFSIGVETSVKPCVKI